MLKFRVTILILALLTLGLAGWGCLKKPAVNQNQNQYQNTNTNINTATSTDDIDTSDWKTYRNEEYGFEVKYPSILQLNKNNNKINFVSLNYAVDSKNIDFILSGFRIEVILEDIPQNTSWKDWVGRPGGSIGKTFYEEGFIYENNKLIRKTSIGNGFANQWPENLRFISINLLYPTYNKNLEITLYSKDEDLQAFNKFEEILKTFRWLSSNN